MAAIASLPQCSRVSGAEDGMSRRMSLATYVGLLDDFAPLRVVRANELRELRGRIGYYLDTLRLKPGLHLGTSEDARHLTVDFPHDVGGRLRRHKDAEPGIDREARQRLRDRRHVTEIRQAFRRRGAERLEPTFLDMRQQAVRRADPNLNAGREQVRHGGRRALVGYVIHFDTRRELEEF